MIDPSTVLIGGIVLLYGGLFTLLAWEVGLQIRQSEHSWWYYAGAVSAWLSFALRNPVAGIVSASGVVILFLVTASISMGDSNDNSNPPPEVAPIYEATLRMPTAYPFARLRMKWPAFFGHRFALGGDRA